MLDAKSQLFYTEIVLEYATAFQQGREKGESMNTLTTFIYQNHTTQPVDVKAQESICGQGNCEDSLYEVIENSAIEGRKINGLTISGALLSLSSFKEVTFENCTFYASKLENCNFQQCKFINCSFEFTNVSHCEFATSEFINCTWQCSPVRSTKFSYCELDAKTQFFVKKEKTNILWESEITELEWSDVLPASKDEVESTIIAKEAINNDQTQTWVDILSKIAA